MKIAYLFRVALVALVLAALASPEAALARHSKSHASSASHKGSKSAKSSKHGKSSSRSKGKSKSTSKGRHRRGSSGASARQTSVVTAGATGHVVEAAATAETYTVKKHEGLDAVVRATGVSKKELAELNHLKEPYHLKVGQKLKVGAGKSARGKGKAYIAAKGDTLSAISRRFGVSVEAISELNHLGKKKRAIRSGQKLLLPSDARDQGIIQAENRPPPPRLGDVRQIPIEPGQPTLPPVQGPTTTVAPVIDQTQVAAAGAGKFIWPVSGKVLTPFDSHAGDKTDAGIDIAAAHGTPVKAAAGGTVLFAGKQIAALGNYVLIQHDGGFFTAYGNLDRLNVRIGQHVSQGEEIGLSGQTGQAAEPKLHFEILYAARREDKSAPLDPLLVLPKT